MEYPDGYDGRNDWENIRSPYSATTAQYEEDDGNDDNFPNDIADLPPSNYEVLPIEELQPATPAPPAPSSSVTEGEREGQLEVGRLKARLGILGSEIVGIAEWIRRYAVCRAGFLSFTSVVAVFLAAVYGRRWLRRRRQVARDGKEHLIHLITQKDQKINQLLFQIARMNEILSGSRRIRVLRVVVNSSHIVTPRF